MCVCLCVCVYLCACVFVCIHLTPKCAQILCMHCAYRIVDERGNCPLCRVPIFAVFPAPPPPRPEAHHLTSSSAPRPEPRQVTRGLPQPALSKLGFWTACSGVWTARGGSGSWFAQHREAHHLTSFQEHLRPEPTSNAPRPDPQSPEARGGRERSSTSNAPRPEPPASAPSAPPSGT